MAKGGFGAIGLGLLSPGVRLRMGDSLAPQCYIRKHGASCLGRDRIHGDRVWTAG